MKKYFPLLVAIISEVFGTTMLKMSEGFTNIAPSIGVVLGFGLAFYALSLTLKKVPLSLAYAIWSGVGTALTALIGIVIWNEPFNAITLGSLAIIIVGVTLLNFSKNEEDEEKPSNA